MEMGRYGLIVPIRKRPARISCEIVGFPRSREYPVEIVIEIMEEDNYKKIKFSVPRELVVSVKDEARKGEVIINYSGLGHFTIETLEGEYGPFIPKGIVHYNSN